MEDYIEWLLYDALPTLVFVGTAYALSYAFSEKNNRRSLPRR